MDSEGINTTTAAVCRIHHRQHTYLESRKLPQYKGIDKQHIVTQTVHEAREHTSHKNASTQSLQARSTP